MLRSFLQKLLKDDVANPSSGQNCLDALRSGGMCFAVVCMPLGRDNSEWICDIQGASDYLNGETAINFLKEKLKNHSAFTYGETIQTGISALRKMVPEGLDANDIEVCVVKKDVGTYEPLPVKEIEKLLASNSGSRRSKWKRLWRSERIGECEVFFTITPDGVPESTFIDGEDDSCIDDCSGNTVMSGKESKRASNDDYARSIETRCEKETIQEETSGEEEMDQDEKESSCTHITLIWSGGWDYRSVKSSIFNWIGVMGKDTLCVMTGDNILMGPCYLKNALLEMTDHPLSIKTCNIDEWSKDCGTVIPFAAVSVVNVHEESSHEVSTPGFNGKKAMSFLTEKLENELDFTYEETIETAFCALQCFWEDVKASEVQACVLRKGEEKEKQLSITEIEHWLSMALPPK